MAKKRKRIVSIIIYSLIVLIIIGLAYSVYFYKASVEESGENFVVCQSEDNCIVALHVHAELNINICGKELDLPLEAGDKAGTHTHKERNLLHFEEKLKYDNKTSSILETEPIKLKSFFQYKGVNIKFSRECIANNCNGDLCNSKSGKLKFSVNGVENEEFENYVWRDKDRILIVFEGE